MQMPCVPLADQVPVNYGVIERIDFITPDQPNADIIINVLWDEGMNVNLNPDIKLDGVNATGWSRRADTIIRASTKWILPSDIEEQVSRIGWALGAGYMYRWHHAPTCQTDSIGLSTLRQVFGVDTYEVMGETFAIGDRDNHDLVNLASECGYWDWEINCAYLKSLGNTAMFFDSWRKHDPTLLEDGSRSGNFPGWNGSHPFLRATEPHTGMESRFFFARPKKYHPSIDVLVKEQIN